MMTMVNGVSSVSYAPVANVSDKSMLPTRLRADNEKPIATPVEAVESSAGLRGTLKEQPGRTEAEQVREVTSKLEPRADGTEASGNSSAQDDEANALAAQAQKRQREAEQDEAQMKEDLITIREMAARDREVRSHEQAHQAVGGQYAGPMELVYEQGPDGRRYAIAGEVSVDVSPVPGDPAATMDKAQVVRRAALAPAEPSPQDRSVAALAAQMYFDAQSELMKMERAEAAEAIENRSIEAENASSETEKTAESKPVDKESDSAKEETDDSDRPFQEIMAQTAEAISAALKAAYRVGSLNEIGDSINIAV